MTKTMLKSIIESWVPMMAKYAICTPVLSENWIIKYLNLQYFVGLSKNKIEMEKWEDWNVGDNGVFIE
jgi:hypothetical protein